MDSQTLQFIHMDMSLDLLEGKSIGNRRSSHEIHCFLCASKVPVPEAHADEPSIPWQRLEKVVQ